MSDCVRICRGRLVVVPSVELREDEGMPKVVETIPSRVYTWDSWLDGRTREFRQGRDFTCAPRSFGNAARKAAQAASRASKVQRVDVRLRGTSVFLTFVPTAVSEDVAS